MDTNIKAVYSIRNQEVFWRITAKKVYGLLDIHKKIVAQPGVVFRYSKCNVPNEFILLLYESVAGDVSRAPAAGWSKHQRIQYSKFKDIHGDRVKTDIAFKDTTAEKSSTESTLYI